MARVVDEVENSLHKNDMQMYFPIKVSIFD